MKKTLVTISLMVSAFACWSASPPIDIEWVIGTKLDDGTRQLYEILPQTAEVAIINKVEVSTALVRMLNIDSKGVALHRILVVGCDAAAGKTTMTELDGTEIAGVSVFDWTTDGGSVFDGLATLTCVAVIMSQKQPTEPIKIPAPTKHQRVPQGTMA